MTAPTPAGEGLHLPDLPPHPEPVSPVAMLWIGPHGASVPYLQECWRYRDVVWFLARRDLVVRYRSTIIGLGWVWLRPVISVLAFTMVFGRIAKLPSGHMPYPLLVLLGMVPWQFFAAVVNESGISLANNPNLITKVWLPRILLPLSTVLPNACDAAVNALLIIATMVYYHVMPSWTLVLAPLVLLPHLMLAIGAGLFCSALMVRYRDVKNLIPVVLQFGLICSPVAFSLRALSGPWARLLWLNPISAPIEWLRWCVLPSTAHPSWHATLWSLVLCTLTLVLGHAYFRHCEERFADDL